MAVNTTAAVAMAPCTLGKKRKRSPSLQVRFCPKPARVIYTYSQSDYDRSGHGVSLSSPSPLSSPFPSYHQDSHSLDTTTAPPRPSSVIVTLSIGIVPPESHHVPKKRQCSRPKLRIDTSNICGPLYFTSMTTNHQKKERALLSSCAASTDLEHDEETKENTRRNGLRSL